MGITHGDDDEPVSPPGTSSEGNQQPPEDTQPPVEQRDDAKPTPAPEGDETPKAPDEAAERREALIKQLTGEAPSDDDSDPEPDSPDADDAPSGVAKSDDEEKLDDPENIPDDEFKALKRRTRKRIEHFRTELAKAREREPFAKYGEDLIAFARERKISPDELAEWVGLGGVVAGGGQKAVDALIGMAQKLGYQPPQPTAAPQKSDGALPDWLQAKVDSYDISPEVARELAARLPAQPPVAATAPQSAPATAQQQQRQPPAGPDPVQVDGATRELERLIAEGAQKFPADWDKRLFPAIKAKMAEFTGAPPSQWPRLFKLAQDAAVASIRTPTTQPKAPLSPGAQSGGGSPKSPRAALVARLTGG